MQGYFMPLCIDFTCLFSSDFGFALYSQDLHLYLIPKCSEFMWELRLEL